MVRLFLSMDLFITIYAAVMGLIVGSFLNVCAYRTPLGLSVAAGRSFCPSCKNTLSWYELVPVLSWLLLCGRCRQCKAHISARYPLVELTNSALWALIYLRWGWQWHTLCLLLLASALLTGALIDWDTLLVPNALLLFLLPLGLLEAVLQPTWLTIWQRVGGLLCVSVPLLCLAACNRGFGAGDAKLAAVCGLLLGWRLTLLGTMLALATGCLYGLGLIARKKALHRTRIAFVPHLAIGFVAAALWGEALLSWYVQLFYQ